MESWKFSHLQELIPKSFSHQKFDFSHFFRTKDQEWSLGPYDKIKKCLEYHPESYYMCKNSSRRTPRPQNFIFVVFLRTEGQEWSLGPYDKIKICLECHPESSYICNISSQGGLKYASTITCIFSQKKYLLLWETTISSGWVLVHVRIVRIRWRFFSFFHKIL